MPKPPSSIDELLSPSRLRSRWSPEPAVEEPAPPDAPTVEPALPDERILSTLGADVAEAVNARCDQPRGAAVRAMAQELADLLADANNKDDLSPGKLAAVAELLRAIEDLLEVEELVARGRSQ